MKDHFSESDEPKTLAQQSSNIPFDKNLLFKYVDVTTMLISLFFVMVANTLLTLVLVLMQCSKLCCCCSKKKSTEKRFLPTTSETVEANLTESDRRSELCQNPITTNESETL